MQNAITKAWGALGKGSLSKRAFVAAIYPLVPPLKRMQPFVWRKHLDFTAIEDAHTAFSARDLKVWVGRSL